MNSLSFSKLFAREEQEGQGLVEYAMILMSVAIVVLVVLVLLGPAITDRYEEVIINFNHPEYASCAIRCKDGVCQSTVACDSLSVGSVVALSP